MRPKRIILIRHGNSEGNADRERYATTPDHALNLTTEGEQQALQAGQEIKQLIGEETVRVYLSPYTRTRQTYQQISQSIAPSVDRVLEDPRLREQDWGHLRPTDQNEEISQQRDNFSTFYYRIPDGESGADVYDRISTFLETMHRDFEEPDYPPNALIVTHGFAMRLFLMRWFHWSVEEFENLRNPRNCEIVVIELQPDNHYKLVDTLRRRH
jgi:broad specificity phosphatase PhoE